MEWMRGPAGWSFVVMFALGCGGSDTGGGGGCGGGSAESCEIDPQSTVCGDLITVVCLDGGSPEAASQCDKALEESGESIYCCTNATSEPDDGATTNADAAATSAGAGAGDTGGTTGAGGAAGTGETAGPGGAGGDGASGAGGGEGGGAQA
jgi:hypothetical protein